MWAISQTWGECQQMSIMTAQPVDRLTLPISHRLHRALLQEPRVPRQRLIEQVWGVLAGCAGRGPVEVVLQRRPVVRVRAVVDDLLGPAPRRQAAKIGKALLGDDDMDV